MYGLCLKRRLTFYGEQFISRLIVIQFYNYSLHTMFNVSFNNESTPRLDVYVIFNVCALYAYIILIVIRYLIWTILEMKWNNIYDKQQSSVFFGRRSDANL